MVEGTAQPPAGAPICGLANEASSGPLFSVFSSGERRRKAFRGAPHMCFEVVDRG